MFYRLEQGASVRITFKGLDKQDVPLVPSIVMVTFFEKPATCAGHPRCLHPRRVRAATLACIDKANANDAPSPTVRLWFASYLASRSSKVRAIVKSGVVQRAGFAFALFQVQ